MRHPPRPTRFPNGRSTYSHGLGLLALLATIATVAAPARSSAKPGPEFAPDVQLAPFVVKGEALTISIHARTKADRRYAERFAEEVIAVAHETLERSTGRGLVIVGRDGEPHPLLVFRRFCELYDRGELRPGWSLASEQLNAQFAEWRVRMGGGENNEGPPIDFDLILEAVPVPLEGVASKLFQVAWAEQFDPARVDDRFRSLTAADLESSELANYHWVFYLPPKHAFDRVLKRVLPKVLAHEEIGLFKRAAIRSALVVMRPAIKKAIEGMRKGMLFMTVWRARSNDSKEDINELTKVYVKVLMPDFKLNGHTEHARAVEAVEAQKRANAAYALDPFVAPPRLTAFAPEDYASFLGDYSDQEPDKRGKRETTHRFHPTDGHYLWQYRDHPPSPFYPAGPRLLVNEKAAMTIEFQVDDTGAVTGVEERWVRRRKTVPRVGVATAAEPTRLETAARR
jgi:hypothetical protein